MTTYQSVTRDFWKFSDGDGLVFMFKLYLGLKTFVNIFRVFDIRY